MNDARPPVPQRLWAALAIVLACGALLHFWGNATRGYIPTSSWFVWWGSQWFLPSADLEHSPLLLFGSGVLVWRAWSGRDGRAKGEAGDWLVPLALGLGAHVVALWLQQPRLSALSLIWFLAAAAGILGGQDLVRNTRTARWLVLLALPWGLLESLGWSFELRLGVATAVKQIAHLFGAGLNQEGTALVGPRGQALEVAAACAGLRSWLALTALALFLGDLWKLAWQRRLAVLAISWVAVVLGNALRIGVLVVLALNGKDTEEHTWLGVAVFFLETLAIAGTASAWERRKTLQEEAEGEKWIRAKGLTKLGGKEWALLVVSLGATVGAGALAATAGGAGPSPTPGHSLISVFLPKHLPGDWSGHEAGLNRIEREILPPDAVVARMVYDRLGVPSDSALVTRVRAGADRSALHRPELCLRGSGWQVQSRASWPLRGLGNVSLLELSKKTPEGEVKALMAFWYTAPGRVRGSFGAMMWDQLLSLVNGRREAWESYAVQTWIQPRETVETAEARLREVALKACPPVSIEPVIK